MVSLVDIKTKVKDIFERGPTTVEESDVLKNLTEFKAVAIETKNHVMPDYTLIEAYYSGNINEIFRDWLRASWRQSWMKFTHVNKTKESVDEILANVIPQWPRPLVVPTRTEYKQLAEAGDALLETVLRRGGYNKAVVELVTMMVKFNTAFISPTLDTLTYHPEKRITFQVDHPANVMITPGAQSTRHAAQVLVTRRIHKEILKGIFPTKKEDIDKLAGPRVTKQEQHGGFRGRKETIQDGAFHIPRKDDPNNVTLELFYQRDYSIKHLSREVDEEKIQLEVSSYIKAASNPGFGPPEDTFDLYDFHLDHLNAHQSTFDDLLRTFGANQALAAYGIHIAKHISALGQDIAGGAELEMPFGKRFALIVGEKEIFYEGPDPHSEFGITDFPIVDYQLTQDGQDYWQVALGRAFVELNASRNRITNAIDLNTFLHGFAKLVIPKDADIDPRHVENDPFQVYEESPHQVGAHRYLAPPSVGIDPNVIVNRIDTDFTRISGIVASFRGELPDRISGKALDALNLQASKSIDVKIDTQRDAVSRFGDMVYKMAIGTVSDEDKALIVGETGAAFVVDFDLEELKNLEYEIHSIPGPRALTHLDKKNAAFQGFIQQIGPIIAQVPQGLALLVRLQLEVGKGQVPELEKFEGEILAIVESLNPQQQMAGGQQAGVLPMPEQAAG